MPINKSKLAPQSTHDKILQIARKLFVAQGFAATSISQIATQANINQSLIYHHFSNKNGLWLEVKRSILEAYLALQGFELDALEQESDFEHFLRQLVTLRFNIYNSNPDIHRMITWQKLEQSQQEFKPYKSKTFKKLIKKIEYFQEQGQANSNYSAESILMFVSESAISLINYPPHSYLSIDGEEQKQAFEDDYLKMISSCLISGLSNKKND